MTGAGVVDAHTHFIPRFLVDEAGRHPEWGVEIESNEGQTWVRHEQGFAYPAAPTFFAGSEKLDDMLARGIDVSVLSLPPTLFFYWIGAADAAAFAGAANDALAEVVTASDGRFVGLASLPMGDPEAAARELRRGVSELGLLGAQIGTSVEGEHLDQPRFSPVLEAADELGVPLMLHPYYVGPRPGLEDYYLTNIFGNPLDTALAASRLIFANVFERFPRLTFFLVHAGGFLPYQIGRLDHGWSVRQEPKVALTRPPSEYLERFYYDTITHHDEALRFLLGLAGDERVLLGTDLPFDMADEDPVARLERVAAAGDGRERVAGANAARLFKLRETTASA